MPGILTIAYELPSRRVTNEDLASSLGTSAEALERATGVALRHYAEPGEGPSDLARRASDRALRQVGLGPGDVELIVFATMTPDVTFPGAGCYLQDKLGCGTVGALDLRAQCGGFLFGLDVATQFLRAGLHRWILLATGEVHSTSLDFSPSGADVTPRFGDGAAVAVLGAERDSVVETVLHTDGREFDRFWCEYPSSRYPSRMTPEAFRKGLHHPRIDVDRVRELGREQMHAAVEEVLERANVRREAVTRFFFHHLLPDVSESVADALGVPDRASVSGRSEGHIASASLPLDLARSREQGELAPGDLVCLATAGSGSVWGATLLRVE